MSPQGVLRFGEFALDPRERRLTRGGEHVHLRPKTFELLVLLAANPHHLMSRRALLEAVWPDAVVTDNTLSRCVREIRDALHDDVRAPRYLKTATKHGYEFVADVVEVARRSAGASVETGEPLGRAPGAISSIAVLPFADLSATGDQEYLCDGVAEEIITALSRLDGLRVVARTSAFAFKGRSHDVREIGRRLGVETLLEGSVRGAPGRLRVTAQLVSAVDGYHLWSERYDREESDILAIQDEIALAIAERLRLELGGARRHWLRGRTQDVEAYRSFLEGRYYFHRRHPGDFSRAIALFERALARDPAYVLPLVAVAKAMLALGTWSLAPPDQAFPRCEQAAARALELDEGQGEAHLALGAVAFLYERDRERAFRRLEWARAAGLTDPLSLAWLTGLLLVEDGRRREALDAVHAAVELDPLSPLLLAAVASVHVAVGEPEQALRLARKAVDLDPGSPVAQHWLGWSLAAAGEPSAAEAPLRAAAASGLALSAGALGCALARCARCDAAREQLEALAAASGRGYSPSFPRALIHAALGEEGASLALLDAALDQGEPVPLAMQGRLLSALLPDRWIDAARGRTAARPRP